MYPSETDRSKYSDSELQELFCRCHNPWSTLRMGKISSCNYAGYASKAGICEDQSNEYFDLRKYSKNMKKELIEFRTGFSEKGYTEFCRKCEGWTSINKNISWSAIQESKK